MSETMRMDRREFVKLLGGGIVVVVNLGPLTLFSSSGAEAAQRGYPEDINAYLHIAPDGAVTLYSGKIEMGQGVMTSLTQMAAEDLRVPLDAIHIVMGDTDLCPFDMGTFGSLTTRMCAPGPDRSRRAASGCPAGRAGGRGWRGLRE
jgi:isoquinoline 1-oxidoreductase